MKNLFILIFATLFFFTCTKDKIDDCCNNNNTKVCESPIELIHSVVDTCFELPTDFWGDVLTRYSNDYYSSSFFNPQIEDEFIFIHRIFGTLHKHKLYKNNLCNEIYEEGFNMEELVNPQLKDYNKNDELLISSNFKIWKVNFDGSELTKITDDNYTYYGAQWCAGDSLIYSCLLYTSPSPRDATLSRMPSSA